MTNLRGVDPANMRCDAPSASAKSNEPGRTGSRHRYGARSRVSVVAIIGIAWVANSFVLGGLWSALNWRRNTHRCVAPVQHEHDVKLVAERAAVA